MNHILLPTDFSDNARNAIDHAVRMYGDEEGVFFLFHTFFTPHTSPDASKEVIEAEKRDAFEQFDEIIEELNKDFSSHALKFEKVFKYGSFNNTVPEIIDDLGIDLIAMGTQGASGLEEVLIGSSTAEVIETVDCPVLAVPQESRYVEPKQLVLALESEYPALEQTIRPLLHLAEKFQSEIHVLHVTGGAEDTYDREFIEETIEGTDHYYHSIESDEVAETIEQFIRDRAADLVGMITHDRNLFQRIFHKSLSRKLVLHTKVPFLAMRNVET